MPVIERKQIAYLSNEDSPTIRNPIHSTSGSAQFGFGGPLVGGVTVYGWAAELVMEVLGDNWLESGWVEMNFKRPVYPEESLTIALTDDDGPGLRLTVDGPDRTRLDGRVGPGLAPWFSDLTKPHALSAATTTSPSLTPLTLSSAPNGEVLRPVPMEMDSEAARKYAREKQHSRSDRFSGEHPLLHPALIASFETSMFYGLFAFSPGIHVSSQIQHLRAAPAAPGYLAVGTFLTSFERNGRHHAVFDGSLIRDGKEYARARQELIFAVPKHPAENATANGGS